MSEARRWAHKVVWEGLQISATYMAINDGGEYVMHADYAALEAENARLRQQLADVFEGNTKLHVLWTEAVRQRDKLAQVLGNVEREHELFRRMKNCEIQRGRGSFGIAVMSDPPALEWQALDKELQQLIDDRRAALAAELAAIKGQEPVGVVHLRKGGGIYMLQVELNTPLHPGTKLYTLPAAPEGGEV